MDDEAQRVLDNEEQIYLDQLERDFDFIDEEAGWNSRANSRIKLPSNPLSQL